jgi:2-polyprenyl-3-methyl-5-hydroxy-6-metoxy-1,4-benzoquinol methylase
MSSFGVKDYESYWRSRKLSGDFFQTRIHRRIVEIIQKFVPGGKRILDCGVGPAIYYKVLAECYEMYGIEFSAEAISLYDFDTSRIKSADLNVEIPDFGVRFDAVIASMIVHHMADPLAFLKRIKGSLVPSGIALIVHPNLTYYKHRLRLLSGSFPKFSSSHRVFLVPRAIEEVIRKAGFSIEKIESTKRRAFARLMSPEIFYVCRSNV